MINHSLSLILDKSCVICYLVTRSLVFMGVLTLTGTGFAAYIMAMAALSPCPLLVHSEAGTAIMVRSMKSLCLFIIIYHHIINKYSLNI